MKIRTDLALENKEYIENEVLDGVVSQKEIKDNIKITRIEIINGNGSRLLDKPLGRYSTFEYPDIISISSDSVKILKSEIKVFLPDDGLILIAGLGNEKITADSLGPKCIDKIIATRHIHYNRAVSPVPSPFTFACVKTDVSAKTGIEASEMILGLVKTIKPKALIIIDSLGARNYKRLGSVIQISDIGIVPGSGVKNHRNEISKRTLNIPVISIGAPTVIDGSAINENEDFLADDDFENVFLTSKNIDFIVSRASYVISSALNSILKDKINITDL